MSPNTHMKILVTGCRGFIGRNIGEQAHARGWSAIGLSRSTGPHPSWPGAHYHGDVASDDLIPLLNESRPDVIVHAAGSASVGQSFESPLNDFRASAATWANVLNSVRGADIDPLVVFISSAAVYGAPKIPISEATPQLPLSPYGYHKMLCETMAREYSQCFGTRILLCRLFSVLGPGQRRLLPWEIFVQLVDPASAEIVLQGSEGTTRDYLHVDDAASAIVELSEKVNSINRRELVDVNVASGHEVSVGNVVDSFRALLGRKPVRFLGIARPGDPNRWSADITRLRSLLPRWEPRPFEAAVEDCIRHWSA